MPDENKTEELASPLQSRVIKPVYTALNTIKASRWELFKAKLFGFKTSWVEDGYELISLHYKGKTYLIDYKAL